MAVYTYVPEYQVVLSRRCVYTCGYCNFPQTPSPFPPSIKQFRRTLRLASRLGASQITLTAGEGSEKLQEIQSTVRYFGFPRWADYLKGLCQSVLEFRGPRVMFPVLDVGRIPFGDLRTIGDSVSSVRLLLEAADDSLLQKTAHEGAPQKSLEERTSALSELGRLRIPTITGIRIGIGENPDSWTTAAQRITGLHRRYRHIQQMVIVPFHPVAFSAMSIQPPASQDLVHSATHMVRRALDPAIPLYVEFCEQPDALEDFLAPGSTDFGCVRLGSTDRVNVDAPATLSDLQRRLTDRMDTLEGRLPWSPQYISRGELSARQRQQIELFLNTPKQDTLPITDLTPPANRVVEVPQ